MAAGIRDHSEQKVPMLDPALPRSTQVEGSSLTREEGGNSRSRADMTIEDVLALRERYHSGKQAEVIDIRQQPWLLARDGTPAAAASETPVPRSMMMCFCQFRSYLLHQRRETQPCSDQVHHGHGRAAQGK